MDIIPGVHYVAKYFFIVFKKPQLLLFISTETLIYHTVVHGCATPAKVTILWWHYSLKPNSIFKRYILIFCDKSNLISHQKYDLENTLEYITKLQRWFHERLSFIMLLSSSLEQHNFSLLSEDT